jgi:thiamine-monophosphate kinase
MAGPGNGPGEGYTEREIIARLARRFGQAGAGVSTGIGDDAAVLELPGSAGRFQVVTTDLLVEGIHFDRRYMSPADIGYKALAVNLSDIAAMGAVPTAAFGCLGLPGGFAKADADALIDGVEQACRESGVSLAGGDTVGAHALLIGFTVLGIVEGKPLLRSGAQPGDLVWHSGSLGLSEAGRMLLSAGGDCPGSLAAAHRRPAARLELGRWLQQHHLATACIDLSDSLSTCLTQLADASGTGLGISFSGYNFDGDLSRAIAGLSTDSGGQESLAEFLLRSAEDYQLLFTTGPEHRERLAGEAPAQLSCLGEICQPEQGRHVTTERGDRLELAETGWQHPH